MTPQRSQGFAALPIERRREIAAQGGRAAHAKGTAHQFTSEEARLAGAKGGRAKGARARANGSSPTQGPKFLTPDEDAAARARAMKSGSVGKKAA